LLRTIGAIGRIGVDHHNATSFIYAKYAPIFIFRPLNLVKLKIVNSRSFNLNSFFGRKALGMLGNDACLELI